jgi:hypothetical protein
MNIMRKGTDPYGYLPTLLFGLVSRFAGFRPDNNRVKARRESFPPSTSKKYVGFVVLLLTLLIAYVFKVPVETELYDHLGISPEASEGTISLRFSYAPQMLMPRPWAMINS